VYCECKFPASIKVCILTDTTREEEENSRSIDVVQLDTDVEINFVIIKLCKLAGNEVCDVYL